MTDETPTAETWGTHGLPCRHCSHRAVYGLKAASAPAWLAECACACHDAWRLVQRYPDGRG